MTLYIKDTDTAIVGTLEHLTGVGLVHELDDDGTIIWAGQTTIDWGAQYTVFDKDMPVWVDEHGSEYRGVQVEDRREGGKVIPYLLPHQDPVRPVTKQIRALWRHNVQNHQTEQGLAEWGENLPIKTWLAHHGLLLAERDPFVNAKFEGAWQITQPYEKMETPMEDAQAMEIFAIVGDDLEELIKEALAWVESS